MISVESMRRKPLLLSHYGAGLINRDLGEGSKATGNVGRGAKRLQLQS